MEKSLKYNKIISILGFAFGALLAMIVFSCTEDNPGTATGPPNIEAISNTTTYWNAVIVITGNNLGLKSKNNFIVFKAGSKYKADSAAVRADSVIKISAMNCIEWNNSIIKVAVPRYSTSGKIFLEVDGTKSNDIQLIITKHAPIEFAEIPTGSFMMGSNTGLTNESPSHEINLTTAFYISKYEISQEIWTAINDSNPSIYINSRNPLHNISWINAIRFCNELSKLHGFDTCYNFVSVDSCVFQTEKNGFRLPTEAEWEYACRAGTSNDYYGNYSLDEIAWSSNNSGYTMHPVGLKKANQFGVFDMLGNAWEYCWDLYDESYYNDSPISNPTGPVKGTRHVIRGGSSQDGNALNRSSNRNYPYDNYNLCGIRLVRSKI